MIRTGLQVQNVTMSLIPIRSTGNVSTILQVTHCHQRNSICLTPHLEKLQIPWLPEKELLQSLADNPALCLVLMNHPASPAPSSSVGLAQTLSLGGSSPPHSGGFTSIELWQIHSHCLAPLWSTAYQNSMLLLWNCFKPGQHLTPSAPASSRCLGLDPLETLHLCSVQAQTYHLSRTSVTNFCSQLLEPLLPLPHTPMKQSEQDSSMTVTAEMHVDEDVIYMTMPMESPSSADGGLPHEQCSAAKEVVATDTSRNIQANVGLIKTTHVTTPDAATMTTEAASTPSAVMTEGHDHSMTITTSTARHRSSASSSQLSQTVSCFTKESLLAQSPRVPLPSLPVLKGQSPLAALDLHSPTACIIWTASVLYQNRMFITTERLPQDGRVLE